MIVFMISYVIKFIGLFAFLHSKTILSVSNLQFTLLKWQGNNTLYFIKNQLLIWLPPPKKKKYKRFLNTLPNAQRYSTSTYSTAGSHQTVTPRYIGASFPPYQLFPIRLLTNIDSKRKEHRELPLSAVQSNQNLSVVSVPSPIGVKYEKMSNTK
jgi:hypothetical protein